MNPLAQMVIGILIIVAILCAFGMAMIDRDCAREERSRRQKLLEGERDV